MNYRNETLSIIRTSQEIISSMESLRESEKEFISKYSEHLSVLEKKLRAMNWTCQKNFQ